jgi:hypothetical protein
MSRRPFSIRLSAEEEAALKKAADADKRTVGSMVRWILTRWLEDHGYLTAGPADEVSGARPAERLL